MLVDREQEHFDLGRILVNTDNSSERRSFEHSLLIA